MSGNLPAKHSQTSLEQSSPQAPVAWHGWSTQPEEEGIAWGRYIAAVQRYKWLIVALAVLGTSIGLLLTRLHQPIYTVQGAVWISPDVGQARAGGAIVPTDPMTNNMSWADLLSSRAVLDDVVRKRRLYLSPDNRADSAVFAGFTPGPNMVAGRFTLRVDPNGREVALLNYEDEVIERVAVGDSVGRGLDWHWAPDPAYLTVGRSIGFNLQSPTIVAHGLAGRLEAVPPTRERAQTMRLRLRGYDPEETALTMNTILRELVNVTEELKKRTHVEVMRTIEGQLGEAERELRRREEAYRAIRAATITQPTESMGAGGPAATSGAVVGSYFEQTLAQRDARRDREQLERLLARAQQGDFSVDAFLLIPAVQTSAHELRAALEVLAEKEAEMRALLVTYTPEMPRVQLLQREIDTMRRETIPEAARMTIALLRQREGDLGRQVATQAQELRAIPTRTLQEMQARRDVAVAEDLFTRLQASHAEASLAALSTRSEISILDTAVAPLMPANANTTPRLLLMAIVAGLVGGVGLALLLDHVDPRLRYPEQVSGELGLPILGAVPTLMGSGRGSPDPEEASQAIESFRSIRLALTHSLGGDGPMSITITSPGAGDGKSLVSANLALSYAEAGYRTLLIDGDTRRGKLHDVFGLDRRPGLVDYLTGDARLEMVLRESGQTNLWMIPCGTRRHRAPELLMSDSLSSLLSSMRERFDVIIVDSPPLGAGSDPYVLATATSNMMLVLRTGASDRKLAEAKLRLVDRLPIRLIGAVMNDVTASGMYRYYSYLYGYSALDEDVDQLGSRVGALPAGRS